LKRREKAKDKEIVMFDRIRVTLSRRNGQKVITSELDYFLSLLTAPRRAFHALGYNKADEAAFRLDHLSAVMTLTMSMYTL
jgi:hypothetical protein